MNRMNELGPIELRRCEGHESFHAEDRALGFDLLSFWQWSSSDVVSNVTRGVLAEYLVAQALGVAGDSVREEWASYDLKALDRTRVEVKSAAYIQSWHQDQLSPITYRVPKTRLWDRDSNQPRRGHPTTGGRVRLRAARTYASGNPRFIERIPMGVLRRTDDLTRPPKPKSLLDHTAVAENTIRRIVELLQAQASRSRSWEDSEGAG